VATARSSSDPGAGGRSGSGKRARVKPQAAEIPGPGAQIVRVLPAVAGIDKEFDYLVPEPLSESVAVGSIVRVDLAGRRVAAWVLESWVAGSAAVGADDEAGGLADPVERPLRPLALVTGWGPEPEVVDLAGWAAWRWAGRRSSLLTTATAEGRVRVLPEPALRPPAAPPADLIPAELVAALAALTASDESSPAAAGESSPAAEGSGGARPLVLRLPPATDPTAIIAHLAGRGPTLVVVPARPRAAVLAERLRRAGTDVALLPDDWAQARAGAAVVMGARAAAWAPCPGLAAVVVVDGHDEALVQEQAPTWSAVDVAVERARRAGAPCVVISPCPTVELLAAATLLRVTPDAERAGWSVLDVVDRRGDDPRLGLYSRAAVDAVRAGGTVLCVLNRVGRTRLLACSACGSIADCERCGAALASLVDGELSCPRCGLTRPVVCRACHSTRLRQLRIGVSRAREELQALAGRAVGEVTAAGVVDGDAEVLVGTEAVLHHAGRADAVVFLDFDQHLLAPRLRAHQEAMALLARASRLAGGRRARGERAPGRVVVQTRLPDHPVLTAAAVADPGRLADHEMEIRRQLRFPPVTALAAVSGPVAPEFIERLRATQTMPGSPGADGSPAAQDAPGASGAQGAQDAPGAQGAQDAPGAQRASGAQGAQDAPGAHGAPGARGAGHEGGGPEPVEVLGPDEGRWLIRAAGPAALADALAAVPRPPGRLRIEVDPQRI
jgi:primosomal protein N' (replication factor Y) (superfamily II helicase)